MLHRQMPPNIELKTVSAKHPSNKGKNKVIKKTHGMVTFWIQLIKTSALKLTPQEKMKFEVAHILLKTNVLRRFKTK